MPAIAAIVTLVDCLALGVLLLVPLAEPLGLADVELPVSAVFGWVLMAVPLGMSLAALIAPPLRLRKLERPAYVQTTFCLCGLTLFICATMVIDSWFGLINSPPEGVDLSSMRSLAAAATSLYAMNVLALSRPFADAVRD